MLRSRFLRHRSALAIVGLGIVGFLVGARAQDAPRGQSLAARRAEVKFLQGRLARAEAEVALAEYTEEILPREIEAARRAILAAAKELERRREIYDEAKRERGDDVAVREELLAMKKAEITVKECGTKLRVLTDYTEPKTTRELKIAVEKTLSDEFAKKHALDRIRAGDD